MNPGTLQTVCQIIMLFGAIVIAIAGYGNHYYGKKATAIQTEKQQGNQQATNSKLDKILESIVSDNQTKLNKQYPIAYTAFGVYQGKDIVPMGLMPENLEIDWDTGKVQSTNNNVLMVTLPNMILNGKGFVGGNVTQVEKRIGAKSRSIIKVGSFNPILEVIGIDGELVVVALGFPADDSKK